MWFEKFMCIILFCFKLNINLITFVFYNNLRKKIPCIICLFYFYVLQFFDTVMNSIDIKKTNHTFKPISTIYSSFLLLTLPITKTEILDLYFLIPEIFLFFSLIYVLVQYTIKLVFVIKQHQKILILEPDLELIQYNKIIQLFNIGTLVVTNKVIRLLKITMVLISINPFIWSYDKFLFNGFLLNTTHIACVKILLLLLAVIILKSNLLYLKFDGIRSGDISIILGFITFCLLLFIAICDFFVLFLLFEMLALLFYIAIAIRQRTPSYSLYVNETGLTKYQKYAYHAGLMFPQSSQTILASFTYFLLNIFITALYLFSLSCLMAVFQVTHFVPLIHYLFLFDSISITLLNVGIIGILIVFLFKLSAAPFHWWIPAVFEGAPIITLMFLAIPFKIAIIFVLCKVLFGVLPELSYIWQPILLLSSILSMIVGSLGLIQQTKLKRFWAYSTINHIGYILLGIGTDSFLGLRAVLIYLVAYILMNLGFFILTLSIVNAHIQQRLVTLNQFSQITKFKYTFLAGIFSIIIFSLIGIPPLLGFWGKYLIMSSCLISLKAKLANFILLTIISTTLLTTLCYLRIWKSIFVEDQIVHAKFMIQPIPLYNLNILSLISLLLVLLPFLIMFPTVSILHYIDLFVLTFF
jgi:NADH-quinone oxidoreductase subunit N